jgi:hypothetical protein
MDNTPPNLTLTSVADDIYSTHKWFSEQAARQINTALTLRNWVIGMYIREYEQCGADRAQYGEKILFTLSQKLHHKGLKSMGERRLREYRLFYQTYPQIWRTLSAKFQFVDNQQIVNFPVLSRLTENGEHLARTQPTDMQQNDPEILVNRLSFSHFLELLNCDTALQRLFYETESLVNNWNVRDLQRAMNSLLFREPKTFDNHFIIQKRDPSV